MGAVLLGLLLLGGGGPPCGARAAERAPPLTRLEKGPWARAEAIVQVRVLSVTDVRAPGGTLGRQVVRARVLEPYKGPLEAGTVFTLVVYGQRPTLDPARPSVPYFHAERQSLHVLFVQRGDDAHAWRLQTLFDLDGDAGREHLQLVRTVAGWVAMDDVDAKARRVVKDLLRMLASGGEWTKTYAARELAWLADARAESFDETARRRLQRLAPLAGSRDQRFWTRRALESLRGRGEVQADAEAGGDPWRAALLAASDADEHVRLLEPLFEASAAAWERQAWWAWRRLDPTLRTWFLDKLAEVRRPGVAPALRHAYGVEEDPETRERIVRTLGFVGGEAEVAWLEARTANERLRRAALLALSRLGLPSARAALERAREAPWADADLGLWIDHLLGRPVPEPGAAGG